MRMLRKNRLYRWGYPVIQRFLILFSFLCLTACGYYFEGEEKIAVSVPYVVGDHEGELTDALVRALSQTPTFRYTRGEGNWILKAKVLRTGNERIGYRYDRDPVSERLRTNIMGTENRKSISAEVSVVSVATGKAILGPQIVKADADYDYADPNSLRDLALPSSAVGGVSPVISFSLGQLDTVGGAGEDAAYPIYRLLAQKIVDGMLASGGSCVEQ